MSLGLTNISQREREKTDASLARKLTAESSSAKRCRISEIPLLFWKSSFILKYEVTTLLSLSLSLSRLTTRRDDAPI